MAMRGLTSIEKSAVVLGLGSVLFMLAVFARICAPEPKSSAEEQREEARLLREANERAAAEREAELRALEGPRPGRIAEEQPEEPDLPELSQAHGAKHAKQTHHKPRRAEGAKVAGTKADVETTTDKEVQGASIEEWEQAMRNKPPTPKTQGVSCCKECRNSTPCGNSCIPYGRQCHQPTGCAC